MKTHSCLPLLCHTQVSITLCVCVVNAHHREDGDRLVGTDESQQSDAESIPSRASSPQGIAAPCQCALLTDHGSGAEGTL